MSDLRKRLKPWRVTAYGVAYTGDPRGPHTYRRAYRTKERAEDGAKLMRERGGKIVSIEYVGPWWKRLFAR